MANKPLLIIIILLSTISLLAQQIPMDFRLTFVGGYNGPNQVPFWMRSNQFGSVPPAGASIGLICFAEKDYNRFTPKKFDWGIGAEGRINVGDPTEFILLEGYGKIKYGIIELKAGRVKEITGLCDTLLSSGAWAVSGNALGIPKIEISIPEFVYLPVFDRIFAIKGNYMHGWMGNWYMDDKILPNTSTFLHQKSFYGRLGKPDWKLKLFGGFNHQVVWGREKEILGEDYQLTPFQTFLYVNISKAYNHNSIRDTRIGNSLGSIDLGFTYDFANIRLFAYHQAIYDAGALYYMANLRDGLNGISFTNKNILNKKFKWNKFLIEFLFTKNQAGETWSPYTTSIYENYYNNGYYEAGWSYRQAGLGNPLISSPSTLKEGLPLSVVTFDNNRVIAFHGGFEITLFSWSVLGKLTFSRNYGCYDTAPEGKKYGGENIEAPFGIFPVTDQFSGFLEASKVIGKGFIIGFSGALDKGELYDDALGIMVRFSKEF